MKKFLKSKFGKFVAGAVFFAFAELTFILLLMTWIDLHIMGGRIELPGLMARITYAALYGAIVVCCSFITLYFLRLAMAAWGLWPLIPAFRKAMGMDDGVDVLAGRNQLPANDFTGAYRKHVG